MRIFRISNLDFAKKNHKINLTKQKVKIFNPSPQENPEKILVIMTKNPNIFCSGCNDFSNIASESYRGFVHSSYTPLDKE